MPLRHLLSLPWSDQLLPIVVNAVRLDRVKLSVRRTEISPSGIRLDRARRGDIRQKVWPGSPALKLTRSSRTALTTELVTIDPTTGVITNVGAASPVTTDVFFGMDFNPVADRFRVVGDNESNRRFNPDTGAPILPGRYRPLRMPRAIREPALTECRTYSLRSKHCRCGGYDFVRIDSGRDTLIRIGGVDGTPSPNGGQLFTIGALGVNATGVWRL